MTPGIRFSPVLVLLWLGAMAAPAQNSPDNFYLRKETFWETASASRAALRTHWQKSGFQPRVCGLMRKKNKSQRVDMDISAVDTLVLTADHVVPNQFIQVVWAGFVLTDENGNKIPLHELNPSKVTGRGFHRVRGGPVSMREERFKGGLIAQAPCEIHYRLDKKYKRLVGNVGIGNGTDRPYSVRFKVLNQPGNQDLCEGVWQRISRDFPLHVREFQRDGDYWLATMHPSWLDERLVARLIRQLGDEGKGLQQRELQLAKEKADSEDLHRLELLDRAVRYKAAAGLLNRVSMNKIDVYLQQAPQPSGTQRREFLRIEEKLAEIEKGLQQADDSVLPQIPPVVAEAQALLQQALIPLLGTEEILFTVRDSGRDGHWYANFGYWCSDPEKKVYAPGGSRLTKLNLRTGKVTDLFSDPDGAYRDPQVNYDGTKFLFCYRKGGTEFYKLHEANIDGSGVRQIFTDPFDDIEPTYLPDGDIMFCSSRCNRWVNCFYTQVATLYRCRPDGSQLRPMSANVEHDNTPWPLPDGRILFTRWEYVDRTQMAFHHLWTINPDGTGQMTYFGNLHPGRVFIDAKPIPGSNKIVAVFCPGHGRREHAGSITVVTPSRGPDNPASEHCLNKGGDFRDPYPISASLFLVARENQLLVMDGKGQTQELYRAEKFLHEPRPVRARPREHRIPARTNWKKPQGQLILQNVYAGRNMAGVEPGEIKKLLILESLPKPVNHSGGPDMISYLGTFTLERVVGTVPVEADGSANFMLPANRPFFFVALDKDDLSVKRMQSFVSVLPGETTSCLGCHESRTRSPAPPGRPAVQAAAREPSQIHKFEGIPDVIDYPRHIQPILDKHCLKCHNYDNRQGKTILSGDYGARLGAHRFQQSYWTLLFRRQISEGGNKYGNRAPRSIGSGASPLLTKVRRNHQGVQLSEREYRTLWSWVETGAAYAGTYASLLTTRGPGSSAANRIVYKKCISCHNKPGLKIPSNPHGVRPHHYRVIPEGAERFAASLLFNESNPENSLALLAPLAKSAGGYGTCPGKVFKSKEDPDYQALLKALLPAGQYLQSTKLYHQPGFRPNSHYFREMKRYGILPADFATETDPIDVFAVEREYWRSFWHRPKE